VHHDFVLELLNEGLLKSSFHKPFQIEKGDGGNFAFSNWFFGKEPFLKRAFSNFRKLSSDFSLLRSFCFSLIKVLFLKQFKILVENIFTCQKIFARRVLKALCESYFALNNNFWIKRQL
jgi:hypothetical protein